MTVQFWQRANTRFVPNVSHVSATEKEARNASVMHRYSACRSDAALLAHTHVRIPARYNAIDTSARSRIVQLERARPDLAYAKKSAV